jgi:hypothetical protein
MIIEMKAAKDAYTWSVEYHNGVTIPEIDDKRPTGRDFAEIDSLQVAFLRLHQADGWPSHNITVPRGAEPVFIRKRRFETTSDSSEMKVSAMHCIGWKSGTNSSYLLLCDDGSELLTSDLKAVSVIV